MTTHEKKALTETVPVAEKPFNLAKSIGNVLWGAKFPKWLWPVLGGTVAAPFLGHYLREKREKQENAIKRLYLQQRFLQKPNQFLYESPPPMREAENAVGEVLDKKAQVTQQKGGMPGGTPGTGGPPTPPSLSASYKLPSSYPPVPKLLPAPLVRVDAGLNILRESLQEAKLRAGKKRTQKLGLDNPVDRDDQSLGAIIRQRNERRGTR